MFLLFRCSRELRYARGIYLIRILIGIRVLGLEEDSEEEEEEGDEVGAEDEEVRDR